MQKQDLDKTVKRVTLVVYTLPTETDKKKAAIEQQVIAGLISNYKTVVTIASNSRADYILISEAAQKTQYNPKFIGNLQAKTDDETKETFEERVVTTLNQKLKNEKDGTKVLLVLHPKVAEVYLKSLNYLKYNPTIKEEIVLENVEIWD